MKIVLGISGITKEEDILPLIEAGVDEFFVGYVPPEWGRRYGFRVCPNRRPFREYNYLSPEDLKAVCDSVHKLGKKIFFALNEHEYDTDRMAYALEMLKLAEDLGYDAAIVSNLALMLEARAAGIKIPFTLSTGVGALSSEVIDFFLRHVPGITRVILPRSLTMREIKKIVDEGKGKVSFEVFGMGDPCTFNDEYCFAWHTEGLSSFCGSILGNTCNISITLSPDWKKRLAEKSLAALEADRCQAEAGVFRETRKFKVSPGGYNVRDEHSAFLAYGISVCGLCPLKLFEEWGIDAVKIPLRGDRKKREDIIRLVRGTLDGKLDVEGCRSLIGDRDFCSGLFCYYNYPSEKIS